MNPTKKLYLATLNYIATLIMRRDTRDLNIAEKLEINKEIFVQKRNAADLKKKFYC
jgi:hypothetical protein